MRHFSLLGDIGSQRTLISESCARRLNLQVVRHEVLALRGYGQSSCAPQAYKVVKVILGKFPGGRTVEFDALVVPDFQPLWMQGISAQARNLSSEGVSLADWRLLNGHSDSVTCDCLLGADFYRRLVSPVLSPVFKDGLWLSFTIYGDAMLSGPIPGGTRLGAPEVVQNVSICNISRVPLVATTSMGFGSCLPSESRFAGQTLLPGGRSGLAPMPWSPPRIAPLRARLLKDPCAGSYQVNQESMGVPVSGKQSLTSAHEASEVCSPDEAFSRPLSQAQVPFLDPVVNASSFVPEVAPVSRSVVDMPYDKCP